VPQLPCLSGGPGGGGSSGAALIGPGSDVLACDTERSGQGRVLVARNPDLESKLAYLVRLPLGAGMVFRASNTWPRLKAVGTDGWTSVAALRPPGFNVVSDSLCSLATGPIPWRGPASVPDSVSHNATQQRSCSVDLASFVDTNGRESRR
jgi:hypothetical protein